MRRVAAIFFAAALAGCAPFATVPQAAGKGEPAGPRVAICYNPLTSASPEVEKSAQLQCPAKRAATRVATDWRLNFCPLFLPARATFACAAEK